MTASGGIWFLEDGTRGTATHLSRNGGLTPWETILDISADVDPPIVNPPPTFRRLGNHSGDSVSLQYFGHYPEVNNWYLQTTRSGGGTLNTMVNDIGPSIRRGTAPLMLLSLKGVYGNGQDGSNIGLRVIATGPSHPDYELITGLVTKYINNLKTLSEIDPSVPIYAALDGEADAKVNKYELWLQNPAQGGDKIAATREEAGIGTNYFLNRLKTEAPLVQGILWWAGTQKQIINDIWDEIGADNVKCVVGDPYTNQNTIETFNKCITDWTNWVKIQTNYTRCGSPPQAIGETGMQTTNSTHTDAQIATYIYPGRPLTALPWPTPGPNDRTLRDIMRETDIIFLSYFDSNADLGHKISTGSYPLACAAMKASFEDTTA